jgi:adenosylcobinamide-phosphate synthase
LIAATEARINRLSDPPAISRLKGALSLLFWLMATAAVAGVIIWLCHGSLLFFPLLALLAATLPAQQSLYQHVEAVAAALEKDDIETARRAVGMIVGRKTETLDEPGLARAAIESLAENFSDGVVAPAFWLSAGGLVGGALYKTINTADSMIGHRSKRYEFYGWASARLDDLVNLPASRLAALYLIGAALFDGKSSAQAAFRAVSRDAMRHRSPNAGWSEAAMAGALDLKLGGPRVYEEGPIEDAFMGDGRREANVQDIRRALGLMRRACVLQFALLLALAIAFNLQG